MKKIKAIYIGDIRHKQCPVFELNEQNDCFEMLIDKEFKYDKKCVEEDADWIIFEVNISTNEVNRLEK
ncbi:hypothetical protein CF086_17355 [Clostridium botulinum]|uniref:hypothetical protein n=1 Tax=Clostridium botulinum TaxID=1491 RepID=UPI0007743695|nr:hypothetical protein [Clostridium botulinum]MBN3352065.1 hypothetical protein [Clostridium botulinum]